MYFTYNINIEIFSANVDIVINGHDEISNIMA